MILFLEKLQITQSIK